MVNVLGNNTASELIAKMYLNERLADVHFVFDFDGDVQKLPAHKLILASISPVFETMFYGSLKEGKEVRIRDADADSFKEFLQFFYLGEVKLTMENIETVVRLADKYDVLEFIKTCSEYLRSKLTINNMLWGYQLAVNLNNEQMIKFCGEKIAESPTKIFSSKAFKRCDRNILKRILELDLRCDEKHILDAALEWAKNACKNDGLDEADSMSLRNQLGDCLQSIRFDAMTVEDFSATVVSNDGLFTPEEFKDIMLQITVRGYEPKIFKQNPRHYKFQWNKNDILMCKRQNVDLNQQCFLKSSEVVWFTSNKKLILGEIRTAPTFGLNHHDPVNVTVSEVSDTSRRVLYEGSSKTWNYSDISLKVALTQPVLIKPFVMYEIHLSALARAYNLCYYAKWNQTVKLGNGHKIQFHRKPLHTDYDTSTSGWIQSLSFNKF